MAPLQTAGAGLRALWPRPRARPRARPRSTLAAALPRDDAAAAGAAPERDADWDSARPFSEIPGPRPAPLVGNMWRFILGDLRTVTPSELPRRFFNDYGPIMKLTNLPGRRDLVFCFDADASEKLLRNEGIWPTRMGLESLGYYRSLTPEKFEGAWGLVSTQGKDWATFRSAVNQTMMQPRNAKLYVGAIDTVSQQLINRMRLIRDEKNVMPDDFYNELSKWALESIMYIALDKRLGCLDNNLKPDSQVQRIITTVHAIFDCLFHLDVQPSVWKYVPTPAYRRMKKNMDWFYGIVFGFIEEAMQRLQRMSAEERDAHEYSVLERLLLRNENPRIAVTMALDMVTAGVDTTSNTSAVVMYQLARNPDKQRRLQQELDSVFPDPDSPVTADKLEQLRYLRACIREAMRVSPIIIGNQRMAVKDLVLCGYQVPRGTDVLCVHSEMVKEERYFPRALEFHPERWLPEGEHLKGTHPFAHMPFGFGPRTCVGRRFAQLEMETFLSKAFRNFNIGWTGAPLKRELRLLYSVASPLKFECVDRV
ncbi:putative cytochrome P450 301a1, mitochondrial [Frankliniella fusca]|uniref:Cytochrome P450 301a1, mitochondrial n=1 Tax=Frankliniella fusca TaxID=407009 RepID=A0AAE1HKA3_9NEOP|nr:putative cytochrome P450 301a1, mitochondrial [Frankliniella fusca]